MIAARMGHEHIVELLLQRGAAVNAQDAGNWTALFNAAWKNHPAVVLRWESSDCAKSHTVGGFWLWGAAHPLGPLGEASAVTWGVSMSLVSGGPALGSRANIICRP